MYILMYSQINFLSRQFEIATIWLRESKSPSVIRKSNLKYPFGNIYWPSVLQLDQNIQFHSPHAEFQFGNLILIRTNLFLALRLNWFVKRNLKLDCSGQFVGNREQIIMLDTLVGRINPCGRSETLEKYRFQNKFMLHSRFKPQKC